MTEAKLIEETFPVFVQRQSLLEKLSEITSVEDSVMLTKKQRCAELSLEIERLSNQSKKYMNITSDSLDSEGDHAKYRNKRSREESKSIPPLDINMGVKRGKRIF